MKGLERSACAAVRPWLLPSIVVSAETAGAGAARTNQTAGRVSAQDSTPTISSVLRQSCCVTSQATSGDIVIGATPTPAETSDMARLRRRSNDEAVAAITGAKKLATAMPSSTP